MLRTRVAVVLALAFGLSTFILWRLVPRGCPPGTLYAAPFTNAETHALIGLICVGGKDP